MKWLISVSAPRVGEDKPWSVKSVGKRFTLPVILLPCETIRNDFSERRLASKFWHKSCYCSAAVCHLSGDPQIPTRSNEKE